MKIPKEILEKIEAHDIETEVIINQLSFFEKGFNPAKLVRSAKIGDGIKKINDSEIDDLLAYHKKAADGGRIMKFVPASGAATRMFKKLQTALSDHKFTSLKEIEQLIESGNEGLREAYDFLKNLNKFAFYNDVIQAFKAYRKEKGNRKIYIEYDDMLEFIISEKGLGLSSTPKALIKFHKYEPDERTALEEHLVESVDYSSDSEGNIKLHFTVLPEHMQKIKEHVEEVLPKYEKDKYKFDISYSVQKKSTDTVAVDLDNNIFFDDDGKIFFRPGGHGALLENLAELNGDIVYIKNIDNVAPDKEKYTTTLYKKILAGYLVKLQEKVFDYLRKIKSEKISDKELNDLKKFAEEDLNIDIPDTGRNEVLNYLEEKLNRPMRACGMVENEGAPGGGPFWIEGKDGSVSLQIVEGAQVDKSDSGQYKIFQTGTYFNPVDIVCGLKDYEGNPFDLKKYRDDDAVFISQKSKGDRELKALELPGLWNGGMYDWITIFVEVPKNTFSPVKEVNDLLKPEHQS